MTLGPIAVIGCSGNRWVPVHLQPRAKSSLVSNEIIHPATSLSKAQENSHTIYREHGLAGK